jgi:Na+/H+-dicarboxylate symporter
MTVLVSIVEGGIPNGGYIGELLFISAYGFPPEALPPAIIIGTLIDPVATLLNATGDTAAAMLINRFAGEKQVAYNRSTQRRSGLKAILLRKRTTS